MVVFCFATLSTVSVPRLLLCLSCWPCVPGSLCAPRPWCGLRSWAQILSSPPDGNRSVFLLFRRVHSTRSHRRQHQIWLAARMVPCHGIQAGTNKPHHTRNVSVRKRSASSRVHPATAAVGERDRWCLCGFPGQRVCTCSADPLRSKGADPSHARTQLRSTSTTNLMLPEGVGLAARSLRDEQKNAVLLLSGFCCAWQRSWGCRTALPTSRRSPRRWK